MHFLYWLKRSCDSLLSFRKNVFNNKQRPHLLNRLRSSVFVYFLIKIRDGTTDTTRTIHLTNPSNDEKEMYTRVLLGNLSIERSYIHKAYCSAKPMDALARQYLWQVKCEYLHGTGHGVGYFLNVHEGPRAIGSYRGTPPYTKNAVITNEPGYYKEGKFGIRIENMLVITEDEDDKFLKYDNITMVPYEVNLFDIKLLSDDFIDYINAFHKKVRDVLMPLLEKLDDKLAIDYLKRKTDPFVRK